MKKILWPTLMILSTILFFSEKCMRLQLFPEADLVEGERFFGTESLQVIHQVSTNIWTLDNEHVGRGYISQSQSFLLTAAHVLAKICSNLNCENSAFKIAAIGPELVKPRTILMVRNFRCIKWLDLCALDLGEDFSQSLPKISWAKKPFGALYMAPMLSKDFRQVKKGAYQEYSSDGLIAELNVTAGYSGSPVFDDKGNIAGILSSGGESRSWNAPAFVISTMLGFDDLYFSDAFLIDSDEIQSVLTCMGEEACFEMQSHILQNRFEVLVKEEKYHKFWPLFVEKNMEFWNEWQKGLRGDLVLSHELQLLEAIALRDIAQQNSIKKNLDPLKYEFVLEQLK